MDAGWSKLESRGKLRARFELTQQPFTMHCAQHSSTSFILFSKWKGAPPMDQQLSVKFLFFEASASGLVSVVLIFVLAIIAMGLAAYRK